MIDREQIKESMPHLTKTVHYTKRRIIELSTLKRHITRKLVQKKNRVTNAGIIKVVFICQYIPAWGKNKLLYEELKNDNRFEAFLLCVPDRISANKLIDPDNMTNEVYDYFINHGYPEAINALIGKDEWLDLKALHPDYVFYNRYDRPMPEPYTSTVVSSYAKVCMIHYGTSLLKSGDAMLDKKFTANTFCLFAESEGVKTNLYRNNIILGKLKLSKAICCGIPAVENALNAKNAECHAWDFSANSFRAIYAPRWTLEPIWGGSSFLKYKDSFLKFADMYPNMDILVRPHPLMFDHFVQSGIMSEEEVNSFKKACDIRKNMKLDTEKEYITTFWNSSVLICDFSSIVIEYFITGKPIIFLTYNKEIDYTDQMIAMLDACYKADNENELVHLINNLMNNIDPLSEKRKEVCANVLIKKNNMSASKNMKQVLLDEYCS